MKAIKINQFSRPKKDGLMVNDRNYCVYLGNQRFIYFASEKQTLNYLAVTNRFLNEILQILNQLYVNAYGEYRQIWFYGDSFPSQITEIERSLRQLDFSFENILIKTNNHINGNSVAFSFLDKICGELLVICENVIQVYVSKKIFVPTHRLKYLRDQIHLTSSKLKHYGTSTIVTHSESFYEIDNEAI
jgi:hypothetical protein